MCKKDPKVEKQILTDFREHHIVTLPKSELFHQRTPLSVAFQHKNQN